MLVLPIARNIKFCKKGKRGRVYIMIWRHEVSNINFFIGNVRVKTIHLNMNVIKINGYIFKRYVSYFVIPMNFAASQADLIIFNDSLNTLTSYDIFFRKRQLHCETACMIT